MKIRSYSELVSFDNFNDRFDYLKLDGRIGKETFGADRYLNQALYSSSEWKRLRDHVIVRDGGKDLGADGHEIYGRAVIHHLNAITQEDILNRSEFVFDPEYLITTTPETHNAIHYGDKELLKVSFAERTPGDTKLW